MKDAAFIKGVHYTEKQILHAIMIGKQTAIVENSEILKDVSTNERIGNLQDMTELL